MSASVTLRQEKQILVEGGEGHEEVVGYALTSWITRANPESLYALFVVTGGVDPEDENWERVATLDDLVNYIENPLIRLMADVAGRFTALGALVGDKIIIGEPPQGWINTNFPEAKFTVASVDPGGNFVDVQATVPFPSAAADLAWTLMNSSESLTRGTGVGKSVRENTLTSNTFLRRHWLAIFDNVEKALDRKGSNESFVKAVVDSANKRGTTYTGVDTETYA